MMITSHQAAAAMALKTLREAVKQLEAQNPGDPIINSISDVEASEGVAQIVRFALTGGRPEISNKEEAENAVKAVCKWLYAERQPRLPELHDGPMAGIARSFAIDLLEAGQAHGLVE